MPHQISEEVKEGLSPRKMKRGEAERSPMGLEQSEKLQKRVIANEIEEVRNFGMKRLI